MTDSFVTIKLPSSSEIKISNSKFMANAFPASDLSDTTSHLKTIRSKYFDASHHPYAFRLGIDKNNFKSSDDGEPSGSSGKPVLEAIDKHKLTNLIVSVTRYFGGTKLGVGGLRRAYFEAADLCLDSAVKIEKLITKQMQIEFDYTYMNQVMNLIMNEKLRLVKNQSDEKCRLVIEVRISKIDKVGKELVSLTNGSAVVKVKAL